MEATGTTLRKQIALFDDRYPVEGQKAFQRLDPLLHTHGALTGKVEGGIGQ